MTTVKPKIPFVTIGICLILTFLFVANELDPSIYQYLQASTSDWKNGSYIVAFTYSLAHTGLWHLLLNVPMILYVGTKIELRYNRMMYLALYIIAAIAGGTFFLWLFASAGQARTVMGASGAKCGLLVFYATMCLHQAWTARDSAESAAAIKDGRVTFVLIAVELVLSLLPNIAWAAHVGGTVVGIIFAIGIVRWRRRTQSIDIGIEYDGQ